SSCFFPKRFLNQLPICGGVTPSGPGAVTALGPAAVLPLPPDAVKSSSPPAIAALDGITASGVDILEVWLTCTNNGSPFSGLTNSTPLRRDTHSRPVAFRLFRIVLKQKTR